MESIATESLKSPDKDSVAPVWHTFGFLVLLLVLIVTHPFRIRLITGHSRLAYYSVSISFELLLVGYVWVLGFKARDKTLREIIGGRWARWTDPFRDIGVAFVFWIVVACALLVARMLLGHNPELTRVMRVLRPQTAGEMAAWVVMSIVAGFCEEILFRGYLQRQFLAWTSNIPLAIVSQAVVFGAAHLYQGWKGAVTITLYGGLFGLFAVVRKSLRPGMMQHAMQDAFSGIALSLLAKHGYM
jgi:membrane protease YdiL (CAAX protease family)